MKKYKVEVDGYTEKWFYKKDLFRTVVYYSNGQKLSEDYFEEYYKNFTDIDDIKLISKCWYNNGQKKYEKYYRDGLEEIIIRYYKNGKLESEGYYKNGKAHRDGNKPAYLSLYRNGQREYEIYYKDGNFHRDGNKPAEISWSKDGKKEYEIYYKDGIDVSEYILLKEKIKRIKLINN